MIAQNMAAICPYRVGDYLFSENPTHPATSWHGTSWEQLQGRMLMGASGTYPVGREGGEAQHTLTVEEMPAHNHAIRMGYGSGSLGSAYARVDTNNPSSPWSGTFATGGGQPHNNLPPYRAVYIWRRTA